MIYTNQPIPLIANVRDKNGVVILTGWVIRFDYFIPTNTSKIPTSSVTGTISDLGTGEVEGEVPETENLISGNMRFQLVAIDSEGKEWPAKTFTKIIYDRGK